MRCKIEGCTEEAHYLILQVCKACYAGLAYWKGRPQRDKRKRKEQLERLNGRMQHMIEHPRNVPHRRRRR